MMSRLAALTAGAVAVICFAPLVLAHSLNGSHASAGEGDAIFVLDDEGNLEPIALRRNGTFLEAAATNGAPRLNSEALAAVELHDGRVHVIFGRRVVATEPVTVRSGNATLKAPASLHLGRNVQALASPTLGGSAKSGRRAPTASERDTALALAAEKLGTTADRLTVGNLTAIDLGRGIAIAGNVSLKNGGTPRTDKRLFFIAETVHGALAPTFTDVQTIKVSEPLLEEVKEQLVDALDLGDGTPGIVTRDVGYDAHTYNVYARGGAGWKRIYRGGGVAL